MTRCMIALMLKGTRDAVLRRIQPLSIHGQVEVDRKVFVGPEIIDDAAATLAVDHVGVEATLSAGSLERSDP